LFIIPLGFSQELAGLLNWEFEGRNKGLIIRKVIGGRKVKLPFCKKKPFLIRQFTRQKTSYRENTLFLKRRGAFDWAFGFAKNPWLNFRIRNFIIPGFLHTNYYLGLIQGFNRRSPKLNPVLILSRRTKRLRG